MSIAILVVAILAILFNFFVLYKCAKTWKIFHVLLLFMVFAASIAFMVFGALVLKTRVSWARVHLQHSQELAESEILLEKLDFGWSVDPGPDEISAVALKELLKRLVSHRRAVWRGYKVTEATADSIKLTPPTVEEGQPARILANDMVVYVFTEVDSGEGYHRPDHYLGEFRTSAADNSNVTLTPTLPMSETQEQQVNNSIGDASVTWTIYEVIPLDGHDMFVIGEEEIDEDDRSDDDNPSIFGRIRPKEQIESYFPQDRLGLSDDEYEIFIQRFLYDGRAIHKIPQDEFKLEPKPNEIWVKVRFQESRVGDNAVQVDAPVAVVGSPSNKKPPYDNQGLAQNTDLLQGSKTEFKVGDVAVFNRDKADEFINRGFCTLVEEVYIRSLQGFNQEFHEGYRVLETLDGETKALTRETASIDHARDLVEKTLAKKTLDETDANYPSTEKARLESDRDKFVAEREEITRYRQKLAELQASLLAQNDAIIRSNQALAAELAAMQKMLADEINERTGDSAVNTALDSDSSAE